MKLFVTGTDTGIGKTVVSAWLALHLQAAYWKPIQCGLEDGEGDRERVARLSGCATIPERYRLHAARSPHAAAAAEALAIGIDDLILPHAERLIVEGAGGVLVPINARETISDLIAALALRVVIVARGTLGTINHTCLSIEALRARSIPILGVIISGDLQAGNLEAIEHYAEVPVLAHLPQITKLDRLGLERISFPERLRSAANTDFRR